ncbi:sensor histidine kinase [Spirochaeta africana]|uniref:histidine kinase n=1 Tax=Spirochaeta africana (strain ATCC 700263 / DSM 8902 / Z-7692) TaxID=889378 RepID=H9UHT0_SPIAZ|nr:ATP-binding protein [Spirochaeta africana]AFG37073.1 histidine kinase [Spirochaeta africana DSM 8902]
MRISRKFRYRLTLVGIAIALVLTGATLGTTHFSRLRAETYATQLEAQTMQAERVAQDIYAQILVKQQLLQDLARLPAVRALASTMPDSNREQDFLQNPHYLPVQQLFELFLQEENVDFLFMGSVHSSYWIGDQWYDMADDYDAQSRNWFLRPQERMGLYVSPPYPPTNAPETRVITLNFPILEDQRFIGSIGLDMRMTDIFSRLEYLSRTTGDTYSLHSLNPRRGEDEYYLIYHPEYSMLDDTLLVQAYLDRGLQEDQVAPVLQQLLSGQPLELVYRDAAGMRRTIVKRTVPQTDWAVLIDYARPDTEAYLSAYVIAMVLILLLIGGLVMGIAVAIMRLRTGNRLLRGTLQQLVAAQDQLLESSRNAALADVIMGLAHEINTPLGNAVMVESVISEQLDEDPRAIKTTLPLLRESLQRIGRLVGRFKELQVTTQARGPGKTPLAGIIRQEFQLATTQNPAEGIRLELQMPKDTPLVPEEFHVIFHELITNSLVHSFGSGATPTGAIHVAFQQTADGIQLEYRDTGTPVSAEIRRTLFDPFVTTARFTGRIGLGLFIVSGIVRNLLGGTIEYQPGYNGNGNTFRIIW